MSLGAPHGSGHGGHGGGHGHGGHGGHHGGRRGHGGRGGRFYGGPGWYGPGYTEIVYEVNDCYRDPRDLVTYCPGDAGYVARSLSGLGDTLFDAPAGKSLKSNWLLLGGVGLAAYFLLKGK